MSLNWHLRSKKLSETSVGGIWPPPWKLSLVSIPAHSRGRISVHLTYEVNCLLGQYNLIHRPPDEDWFLCSGKQTHKLNSTFIILFQMHSVLKCLVFLLLSNIWSTHIQSHFHLFAISKMSPKMGFTVHHQFGWIAVFLAHHIGAHAHVHACVTLSGVWYHQFTPAHLNTKKYVTHHQSKHWKKWVIFTWSDP